MKLARPQLVSQDDQWSAFQFLALRERATQVRTAAEDVKKIGGNHPDHYHGDRSARLMQAEATGHEARHTVEGGALRAPIEQVGQRNGTEALARLSFMKRHQTIGFGVRQTAEQQTVHGAEYGGAGADAQRQGQDDGDAECRRAAERPERVPNSHWSPEARP